MKEMTRHVHTVPLHIVILYHVSSLFARLLYFVLWVTLAPLFFKHQAEMRPSFMRKMGVRTSACFILTALLWYQSASASAPCAPLAITWRRLKPYQ